MPQTDVGWVEVSKLSHNVVYIIACIFMMICILGENCTPRKIGYRDISTKSGGLVPNGTNTFIYIENTVLII